MKSIVIEGTRYHIVAVMGRKECPSCCMRGSRLCQDGELCRRVADEYGAFSVVFQRSAHDAQAARRYYMSHRDYYLIQSKRQRMNQITYILDKASVNSVMEALSRMLEQSLQSGDQESATMAEQTMQMVRSRKRITTRPADEISRACTDFERTSTLSKSSWPWHTTADDEMPRDGFPFLVHRRGFDRYIVDRAFWSCNDRLYIISDAYSNRKYPLTDEDMKQRYDLWQLFYKLPEGYGE